MAGMGGSGRGRAQWLLFQRIWMHPTQHPHSGSQCLEPLVSTGTRHTLDVQAKHSYTQKNKLSLEAAGAAVLGQTPGVAHMKALKGDAQTTKSNILLMEREDGREFTCRQLRTPRCALLGSLFLKGASRGVAVIPGSGWMILSSSTGSANIAQANWGT